MASKSLKVSCAVPGFVWRTTGFEDSAFLIEELLDIIQGRTAVLTITPQDRRSSELSTDHVLAGTVYRADLDVRCYLGPELRATLTRTGGARRLDGSFQSSIRGLFFTGLASAATGPLMRICAAHRSPPRDWPPRWRPLTADPPCLRRVALCTTG